ncbi:hypothetical protein Tco_0742870 [Tanacetum coccineum]
MNTMRKQKDRLRPLWLVFEDDDVCLSGGYPKEDHVHENDRFTAGMITKDTTIQKPFNKGPFEELRIDNQFSPMANADVV